MNKCLRLVFSLSFFLISGCAFENGRYAMISDKAASLYALAGQGQLIASGQKSISSRHVAIIIPLNKAPTIDAALENVLKRYNGDYLTNVEIKRRSAQLMFWYHYNAWEITGDVMKIK